MSADMQGNDLSKVAVPTTGAIMLVPYNEANKITSAMIADNIAKPTLPAAYDRTKAALGLITSDGGPQDSRDADDPTKFYQSGYLLNGSATLSTSFTVAEDNELTRRITLGEPDENGVYAVDDIIADGKWCAYQEEAWRGGRIRRRAGVVQVTDNAPGQSENGSVIGKEITVEWQEDPMYGGHKYLESIYDPAKQRSPQPNQTPNAQNK